MVGREIDGAGRTWPTPKRDAAGRTVLTLEPMRNGSMEIPKGTRLKVIDYKNGEAALSGEPCPHCGLTPHIRKVGLRSLRLLDAGE